MQALDQRDPVYPESDGQPMAENTRQWHWIAKLVGNLDRLLPDFVAGDLFWYPVQGDPDIRVAPDVLVAIGRPKGHRGSYRTWDEDNVVPKVVMEVLSPSNTVQEMFGKLGFYDRHGVEEFYVLDPEVEVLEVFLRRDGTLREVPVDQVFVSPLLGVRFERRDAVLTAFHPDGRPFQTMAELGVERDLIAAERDAVVTQRDAIVTERDAIVTERDAIVTERDAIVTERDAIVTERDAIVTERDAVAAERDAIVTERDAVAAERDAIVTERNRVAAERDDAQERAERLAAQLREAGLSPAE